MNYRLVAFTCLCALSSVGFSQDSEANALGKKVTAEGVIIEKLIGEYKFDEAKGVFKRLMPVEINPYRDASLNEAFFSSINHYNYARIYFLGYRLLNACGEWENALAHIQRAQEISKANKLKTEQALLGPVNAYTALRESGKKVIEENFNRIKELKEKKNPTNAELNELDDYLSAEKNFSVGEEQAKTLLYAWDRGTKYANSYDSYAELIKQKIESQENEIASYEPAKYDKSKWAEAVAKSQTYLASFPSEQEKIFFLYRLLTLSPESKVIKKAIEKSTNSKIEEKRTHK